MLTTNIWLDYRGSMLRPLTQPATTSTVITSVCPSQRNVEDVSSNLSFFMYTVYQTLLQALSLSLLFSCIQCIKHCCKLSLSLLFSHTRTLSLTADVYNQTYVPIPSNFCTLLARTSTPQAASVPVLYLSTSPQLSVEATATLPSLPLPPSQQTRNFEKTTKKRTKKTILKRDLVMLCVKRSLLTVLVMLLLLV